MRWAPGGDALLSGGADRAVVLTPLTGSSSTSVAFDAGVLCLDVHVALGLVAVGVMDGTVAIYDASLNEVRRFARHHRKYAHAVSFGGLPLLASASYDHSLSVFSGISGTFHSLDQRGPVVLNPEDGIWRSFGKSGPSNWCGMSGRYHHADIRN